MSTLEALALALVAIYFMSLVLASSKRAQILIRYFLIAAAGWTTEETCILVYRFYQYSGSWYLTVGHVPVLIALVWPAVVKSAWDIACQLTRPGTRRAVVVAAGIVLTDALLIEPVAVSAGLWSWNAPGIFKVPPVGILGWAGFAFLCIREFYINTPDTGRWDVWLRAMLISVVGTHLLVMCAWWGVFRWINAVANPVFCTATAWGLSFLLTLIIIGRRTGRCVKKKTLLLRLPAAVFVFSWFGVKYNSPSGYLIFYAAAFALPYLVLMAQQYLSPQKTGRANDIIPES
jgi:hypothetical protein